MTSTARVLLLDQSPSANGLIDKIEAQGYTAIAGESGRAPADSVAGHHPDLILIDNAAETRDGIDLIRVLKTEPETRSIPIIMVDPSRSPEVQTAAFEAGADDVVGLPLSDASLFARIRSLVRLHNMHTELMRRRDTMERFTIDVPPQSLDSIGLEDARVLVIGRAVDESLLAPLERALSVERASEPLEGIERLTGAQYDAAIVVSEPGDSQEMLTLCSDIRNNVSLFNLPVLLVLGEAAVDDAETAYRNRVSDVLIPPLAPADLAQRTKAWIRQLRYRRKLFQLSSAAPHILNLDGLTGLYSHGFMLDYLQSLVEDTEVTTKSFSIGYMEMRGLPEINRRNGYSAGDHLLRQVGQTLSRLVRAEDLPARFRGKEFCIILPETPHDVARKVIDRIVGIIHSTEFLVMGCLHALKADLASGVAEYRPGDTADSLIGRADQAAKWSRETAGRDGKWLRNE